MSGTGYPPSLPVEDASAWRRIRKYAVPRWMVEQATERREAGDWRGACAAANVDLLFSVTSVRTEYGADTATALEDDLRHFAPDLLRWHMPRYLHGRTTLQLNRTVVLASYGEDAVDGPFLYVAPLKMSDGPQRLALRFGTGDSDSVLLDRTLEHWENWTVLRHLWDARNADGLRLWYESGIAASEGGDVEQAFSAAGISLDHTPPRLRYSREPPPLLQVLNQVPFPVSRLRSDAQLFAEAGFGTAFAIPASWPLALRLELGPDGGASLRLCERAYRAGEGPDPLPEACWQPLPDLDLLQRGDITPENLHPLVRASLFPDQVAPANPLPAPPSLVPVRVRCRGEWHEVQSAGGRMRIPHSENEIRREQAMHALGGQVTGCFAVQRAWTSGTGWLPKGLRDQRREFFMRVQHGDTPSVIELLDAGVDPRVRNGRQQTLLHLLHLIDHARLLPRLLKAGLDIEARDHYGRTPLHVMAGEGSLACVEALLDAGARVDTTDRHGMSLPDLIVWNDREDLSFLREAVERDYPNLAAKYGSRTEQ